MLVTYIKYIFILLTTYFIYTKLLNIFSNKKAKIYCLFSSILISTSIYFVHTFFLPVTIFFIVIAVLISSHLIYKTTISIGFITTMISICISYICFFVATFLVTPLGIALYYFHHNRAFSNIICLIVVGIIQLFLSSIPFKFKRLKKGMPFLYQPCDKDLITYICILILGSSAFISTRTILDKWFAFSLLLISIGGIFLLMWWKKDIKQAYANKIRLREISNLEGVIENQQNTINDYKAQHDKLSSLIHKDNKLIPSLTMAVSELINLYQANKFNEEALNRANNLLKTLEEISSQRKFILAAVSPETSAPEYTHILQIDAIINYMYQRAKTNNINFSVKLAVSSSSVITHIISISDLSTLIADLLENAIIACNHIENNSTEKSITLSIKEEKNTITLSVIDTGIPFPSNVLNHMGQIKITSHRDEGGSGIGLYSTILIAKKYLASCKVLDFETTKSKVISLCFDKQSMLIINHNKITFSRKL